MSLTVAVVGSVDNGKSTLIGRLLSDTGQVSKDRKQKVQSYCEDSGRNYEYAFLLDALEEEQSRGITIDVAEVLWKFSGRQILFIDTPGHREFLKKMIGGASRVDGAILLLDAVIADMAPLLQQLKLLDLLGIDQKVILLNKMDLVGWDHIIWDKIKQGLESACTNIHVIPISAWHGENLTSLSAKMPWYNGPTLLQSISLFKQKQEKLDQKARFQVQDVYKSDDRLIYVGRMESGQFQQGDAVEYFPGNKKAVIKKFETYGEQKSRIVAGDSVGLILEGEGLLERGAWLYPSSEPKRFLRSVSAEIFWLDQEPLKKNEYVKIKLGTITVSALVEKIHYEWEEGTLRLIENPEHIRLMGRVSFLFDQLQAIDLFDDNEVTSRFVVCREYSVVGGGRWLSQNSEAKVFWFTGLSGAGKTTLAQELKGYLLTKGQKVCVIDGDVLRQGVSKDLGFSNEDRLENIRRGALLAKKAIEDGSIVLATFISPLKTHRDLARKIIGENCFYEIFVDCSVEECERRDVKGLYAKARRGEIKNFTGIDSIYEPPEAANLCVNTEKTILNECLFKIEGLINSECAALNSPSKATD